CLKEALAAPLSNNLNAKLFLLIPTWLLSFEASVPYHTRQATIVRRCQQFLTREWRELHEQALNFPERSHRPSTIPDVHEESLLRTASTLVHNGYISLAASRL